MVFDCVAHYAIHSAAGLRVLHRRSRECVEGSQTATEGVCIVFRVPGGPFLIPFTGPGEESQQDGTMRPLRSRAAGPARSSLREKSREVPHGSAVTPSFSLSRAASPHPARHNMRSPPSFPSTSLRSCVVCVGLWTIALSLPVSSCIMTSADRAPAPCVAYSSSPYPS